MDKLKTSQHLDYTVCMLDMQQFCKITTALLILYNHLVAPHVALYHYNKFKLLIAPSTKETIPVITLNWKCIYFSDTDPKSKHF